MPAGRLFVAIVILSSWFGVAHAGELSDFNAAVEAVFAHNRVALGYLRAGNTNLASLELDRLRANWRLLTERFAGKRPDAFDGNPLYAPLFTTVSARLVAADLMLNSGRPDSAVQSLAAIRTDFYELRKASGVVVLADCVRDANAAMDALVVYDDRALDWSKSQTRNGIASSAATYGLELARCDAMAGTLTGKNSEFRRLIDGAKAGLALIPEAIATRDGDLLHRILIELRSFDNLLAFRFG